MQIASSYNRQAAIIESSFERLETGRSKDTIGDLKALREQIDTLAAMVLHTKGTLVGSEIDFYNSRFDGLDRGVDSYECKASTSKGAKKGIPKGLTTGTMHQLSLKGGREICSGTAVAFLDGVLNRGHRINSAKFIDSTLVGGLGLYESGLKAKSEQARVLGISDSDQNSRQFAAYNLVDFAENGLVRKRTPKSAIAKTPERFSENLQVAIHDSLIPEAQKSSDKRAGMTLSFNGKTYAISVELNGPKASFLFYDSHGRKELGGNAYTFESSNIHEFTDFIGRQAEFMSRQMTDIQGLTKEEIALLSMDQDGDNEMGFMLLAPNDPLEGPSVSYMARSELRQRRGAPEHKERMPDQAPLLQDRARLIDVEDDRDPGCGLCRAIGNICSAIINFVLWR